MPDLNSSDLHQLIESAHRVHACESTTELCDHVQQLLRTLISADVFVWNELTVDGKISTARTYPDLGDAFWTRVAPAIFAHIHEHPFVHQLNTSRPPALTASISDLLPTRRFLETGLYQTGYKEFAAKRQISSAMDTTSGTYLVLSLNRATTDFTRRDKVLLECIARQTKDAYRNLKRVENLTNQLWSLAFASEGLESTWLFFDERRLIQWGAPNLHDYLRRHFQVATLDPFLPAVLAGPVAQSFAAWADNRVAPAHRSASHRLTHAGRSYQLLLDHHRHPIYRLGCAALPNDTTRLRVGALLQKLSRREKEVASWVAESKTNPEIAAILGISSRTVEKHVHAALSKIGLENRMQLARCVYEQPSEADLRATRPRI